MKKSNLLLRVGTSAMVLIVAMVFLSAFADTKAEDNCRMRKEKKWVDSVFKQLSPRERISQLFVVSAYSRKPLPDADLEQLVEKENIGGLIFFQGTPYHQAVLTNHYQHKARTPLLVSIDGEWGVAMRLDSVPRFPYQMTLGAVQEEALIEKMGCMIGEQCNRLGIHLNYAPVVDVNNNPDNPVINYRSFGEDKYNVARKGVAYMQGMQHQRVLANAKHFPGHGDTDSDSHHSLPVIKHSRVRLDSLEMYPFRRVFEKGIKSVMIAHLQIPSLDARDKVASSISEKVVQGILKDSLGFEGLVLTDALNMKGVANYHQPGELEVKALLAGNDMLLCSKDPALALDYIEKALEKGVLSQKQLDQKCKKVLHAKYWAGLNKHRSVAVKGVTSDLFPTGNELLTKQLYQSALTLLKNEGALLPLTSLEQKKIMAISIGQKGETAFQAMLKKYAPIKTRSFGMQDVLPGREDPKWDEAIRESNLIIIGLHAPSRHAYKKYGVSAKALALVAQLAKEKEVLLCVFGNPYMLNRMEDLHEFKALMIGYENETIVQELMAQAVFGAVPVGGRLPVSISDQYRPGDGIDLKELIRLRYGMPEEVGVDRAAFEKVDSLAINGIVQQAYPGCQLMVAKKGVVIYDKVFGFHTYDSLQAVRKDDLYDIASVTKLSAATLAVMKLVDKGVLHPDSAIRKYLDIADTIEMGDLTLREIMAHNARLVSWIPFYQTMFLKPDSLSGDLFASIESAHYDVQLGADLYISSAYKDSVYQRILSEPLLERNGYRYSDLGFYLIKMMVEEQTGKVFEELLDEYYYKKMGLSYLQFNPVRNNFPVQRLIATEKDTVFRKQQIKGFVHDQGAAILGGVSGHAGLFSNANDLMILMQMMLNKGRYGGECFFADSIFDLFNTRYFDSLDNRRGLGLDKPLLEPGNGPTCQSASQESFGHTGFTGTMVWADPQEELVYVFLSNRIYPDAGNNKLSEMNIRTDIQQVVYDALKESEQQMRAKQ